MRTRVARSLVSTLLLAGALLVTGCADDGDDAAGPGGGAGGGADLDITLSTPASGNTNISGTGVTVTTTADTLSGTPVTRVQVDATTSGYLRRVLVYFETANGTPRAVSYFWGVADLNDNIVHCPQAGCAGVTVNQTTKEIFFANTALDDSDPFTAPGQFATISVGGIQYP